MQKSPITKIASAVGTTLCVTALNGATQNPEDFDKVIRELNIMENIFVAAMQEDAAADNRRYQGSPPDSLYLANQGVVFTFDLRRTRNRFQTIYFDRPDRNITVNLEGMSEKLVALGGELAEAFPEIDMDEVTEQVNALSFKPAVPAQPAAPQINSGFMIIKDFFSRNQTDMHMAQEIRAKQEHLRKLQQNIRELENRIRRGDYNEPDRETRLAEMNAERELVSQEYENQRAVYDEFIQEMNIIRTAQMSEENNKITDMVVTTLCDYGRTLRSLEDDENVTVVFENYLDDEDRLYVFSYRDLKSCNTPEDILNKATSYNM